LNTAATLLLGGGAPREARGGGMYLIRHIIHDHHLHCSSEHLSGHPLFSGRKCGETPTSSWEGSAVGH